MFLKAMPKLLRLLKFTFPLALFHSHTKNYHTKCELNMLTVWRANFTRLLDTRNASHEHIRDWRSRSLHNVSRKWKRDLMRFSCMLYIMITRNRENMVLTIVQSSDQNCTSLWRLVL
jgi:hypothetical protein